MKAYPFVATSLLALGVFGIRVGVDFAQATPPVQAQPAVRAYTITNLGTLGGTSSYANGINDKGDIVGQADTPKYLQDAFIYSAGKMIDLGKMTESADAINGAGHFVGQFDVTVNTDDPLLPTDEIRVAYLNDAGRMKEFAASAASAEVSRDTQEIQATAVNSRGQVAGVAIVPGAVRHAFLFSLEKSVDLGTLSGAGNMTNSKACGINDAGLVVGWSDTAAHGEGAIHAFVSESGVMRDLGTLGGKSSCAYAINNNGQIVGRADDAADDMRAFVVINGKMQDLGAMGHSQSSAHAINTGGQVVGDVWDYATDGSVSDQRAFLYAGGKMQDLNALAGATQLAAAGLKVLVEARGINDRGQIVGVARDTAGNSMAYLMTPAALAELPRPVSQPAAVSTVAAAAAKKTQLIFPAGSKEDEGVIMAALRARARNPDRIEEVDIDTLRILPPLMLYSVDPSDLATGVGLVNALPEISAQYPVTASGKMLMVVDVGIDPQTGKSRVQSESMGLYSDAAEIVNGRIPANELLRGDSYEVRLVQEPPPYPTLIWLKAKDRGSVDLVYPLFGTTDPDVEQKLYTVPDFLKAYGPKAKELLEQPRNGFGGAPLEGAAGATLNASPPPPPPVFRGSPVLVLDSREPDGEHLFMRHFASADGN